MMVRKIIQSKDGRDNTNQKKNKCQSPMSDFIKQTKVFIFWVILLQLFYVEVSAGVVIINHQEFHLQEIMPQENPTTQSVILDFDEADSIDQENGIKSHYPLVLKSGIKKSFPHTIFIKNRYQDHLGTLTNQNGHVRLKWMSEQRLGLDLAGMDSTLKSFILEDVKGAPVHILSDAIYCPTKLNALRLQFSKPVQAIAPLSITAKRLSFNGLVSNDIVSLTADQFTNRGKIEAPTLIIKVRKGGKNLGTLSGKRIFLSDCWENKGVIKCDVLQVTGKSFSCTPESMIYATVGFFANLDELYQNGGLTRTYLHSIIAPEVNFPQNVTDGLKNGVYPCLQAGYLWLETKKWSLEYGTEEDDSPVLMHLKLGGNIQYEKGVEFSTPILLGEDAEAPKFNVDLESLKELLISLSNQNIIPWRLIEDLEARGPPELLGLDEEHSVVLNISSSENPLYFSAPIFGNENTLLKLKLDPESRLVLSSEDLPRQVEIDSSKYISFHSFPYYLESLKIVNAPEVRWSSDTIANIETLDAPETKIWTGVDSIICLDNGTIASIEAFGSTHIGEGLCVKGLSDFHHVTGSSDSQIQTGGSFQASFTGGDLSVDSKEDARIYGGVEKNFLEEAADRCVLQAKGYVTMRHVNAGRIEASSGRSMMFSDCLYKKLIGKSGESTWAQGEMGDEGAYTKLESGENISGSGSFKGVLDAKSKTFGGAFDWQPESTIIIKADRILGVGQGKPYSVNVRLSDAHDFLNSIFVPGSSFQPKNATIDSDTRVDLSHRKLATSIDEVLIRISKNASDRSIDMTGADLEQKLEQSLTLDAENLYLEDASIKGGSLALNLSGSLKAARSRVEALCSEVDIKGDADYKDGWWSVVNQKHQIDGKADVSGAQFFAIGAEDSGASSFPPELSFHAGSIKGETSKTKQGGEEYSREVAGVQPTFICKGGPAVIIAKKGFWLQAPILQGSTLTFSSEEGDVDIDALSLEEIERSEKSTSTSHTFGWLTDTRNEKEETRKQTILQPNIQSADTILTEAKEGKVNINAPVLVAGGDWKVHSKYLGIKAATAHYHFTKEIKENNQGFFGGSTSEQKVTQDVDHIAPPTLRINGDWYIHCDDSELQAVQAYVRKVLKNKSNLKMTAAVANTLTKQHIEANTFTYSMWEDTEDTEKKEIGSKWDIGGIESDTPITFKGEASDITYHGTEEEIQKAVEAGEKIFEFVKLNEEKFSEKDGKTDTKYFNVALCTIAGLVTSYATCGLVPGSGFLVTGANVGIQTATTTYVNTFLSSGGSPRAAYESVFSESGLKNIGISALSASILHQLNISSASGPDLTFWDRFNSRFQTHAVNGSFNVLFRDADLLDTFQSVLFNSFADAVDIHLATEIGKQKGTIDPLAHKLAHGFTGGLTGCIKGMVKGDIGHAALSGVVAGVSSECLAELYSWASGRDEILADLAKQSLDEAEDIEVQFANLVFETQKEIENRELGGEVLDASKRHELFKEKLRAMKGYDIHHEFFEKACSGGMDAVDVAIRSDLSEYIFHKKFSRTETYDSFCKTSAKNSAIVLAALLKLDPDISADVAETALEENWRKVIWEACKRLVKQAPKWGKDVSKFLASYGLYVYDIKDITDAFNDCVGSVKEKTYAAFDVLVGKLGTEFIYNTAGHLTAEGICVIKYLAKHVPAFNKIIEKASSLGNKGVEITKTAEKAASKAGGKSAGKSAAKSAASQASGKASGKGTAKVVSKSGGKSAGKSVEKATSKVGGDCAEKAAAKGKRKPVSKRGGRILATDIPKCSKLEFIESGCVKLDGVEFRGVRNLDHLSLDHLADMVKKGIAAKDFRGIKLEWHHMGQLAETTAGAFLVQIRDDHHCISDRKQHPEGNKKGAGLTPLERASSKKRIRKINKELGMVGILKRNVSVPEMLELGIGKRTLKKRGLL